MKQIKQQNTVICLLSKPVSFAAHQSVHCCIDQAHRQFLFFLTLISSQIAIHHSATHILHSVLSDLSHHAVHFKQVLAFDLIHLHLISTQDLSTSK